MHPPFHVLTVLTDGTNQYRYKAISCVVPDDHGKGKVCKCIANGNAFMSAGSVNACKPFIV